MRAFEFNLQTRRKRLAHEGNVTPIGRVNVFQQNFPVIDSGGERHHTGGENVCRAKLMDVDDTKATNNVGDEPVHLLKIANVIARQLTVGLG